MIKEKKCKGQGKALGYGCGALVPVSLYGKSNRTYGLGHSCGCYPNWLLNSPEGQEKMKSATLKATESRRSLEEAKKNKKERQSLSWLLTNVKNVCHKYIKLRDRGKPCVSCGQPWSEEHQAGHWKKAELYSTLRFDERNIHNQCKGCNLHKDGNVQNYADRIHLRIGRDGREELERLAELEGRSNHKWDREELKNIRDYYQAKIKKLTSK